MFWSKKASQLRWKDPKKGKKTIFLEISKIFNFGLASAARELKIEVQLRI